MLHFIVVKIVTYIYMGFLSFFLFLYFYFALFHIFHLFYTNTSINYSQESYNSTGRIQLLLNHLRDVRTNYTKDTLITFHKSCSPFPAVQQEPIPPTSLHSSKNFSNIIQQLKTTKHTIYCHLL